MAAIPGPDASPSGRRAMLLGATGLVGAECLKLLLAEPAYKSVVTPTRRPPSLRHPKLEAHDVDFDRLADDAAIFAVDDVFCCLGTTIRTAGSQAAFRRVDLEYPREAARLALEHGAARFILVSAVGADAGSRVFYSRVKGEVEAAVSALGYPRVVVARPSLLLGERAEPRPMERVAMWVARPLAPLLVGPLARYRPIAARDVATALVRLALENGRGVRIVESDELTELAR